MLAVTEDACVLSSVLEEQPLIEPAVATAKTATASAQERLLRLFRGDVRADDLFSIVILAQIRALPPAATQRLKQRRRIGITIGLGQDQVDTSLLIGLLGAQ